MTWNDFPPRPLVMGVLNVTPDSFSDGGAHYGLEAARAHGERMAAAGADILDVGGESTRPGALPVSPAEEQARILPVIAALRDLGLPISVDTRNAATMEAAVGAGAVIVNDVSGLAHDPNAAAAVARLGCNIVIMHMRGTPETMGGLTEYDDLIPDMLRELQARLDAAQAAGIAPNRIALDPGLGFAKRGPQNIAALRALPEFAKLGRPLLVGASRKRFIGEIAGEPDPARRGAASLAAHLFAIQAGARIIRTHEVAETAQAIRIWQELTG